MNSPISQGDNPIIHQKRKHIPIEYESSTPSKKNKKEPNGWEEIWNRIEDMRSKKKAPVDSMGCSELAERDNPKVFRYQTLIGLMLSSQTKDPITAEAMDNLKKHGLTVSNILNTEEAVIDKLISKVGFHQRKANYIKKTTQILRDKYKDDIPSTAEELMELPGIGPKMAMLCMQEAWKNCVGIGVDVHVHRISNRLKWVKKTKNPEETRMGLESWLPKDRWSKINKLLVGFGQTICFPRNPNCKECLANDLCPSAFKESKKK